MFDPKLFKSFRVELPATAEAGPFNAQWNTGVGECVDGTMYDTRLILYGLKPEVMTEFLCILSESRAEAAIVTEVPAFTKAMQAQVESAPPQVRAVRLVPTTPDCEVIAPEQLVQVQTRQPVAKSAPEVKVTPPVPDNLFDEKTAIPGSILNAPGKRELIAALADHCGKDAQRICDYIEIHRGQIPAVADIPFVGDALLRYVGSRIAASAAAGKHA